MALFSFVMQNIFFEKVNILFRRWRKKSAYFGNLIIDHDATTDISHASLYYAFHKNAAEVLCKKKFKNYFSVTYEQKYLTIFLWSSQFDHFLIFKVVLSGPLSFFFKPKNKAYL